MPTMTPNEVAKRTGRSRRTVMRAISKGELNARRTNDGWAVEEAGLEAWAPAHAQADAQAQLPALPAPTMSAQLEERIRGLEMVLDELRTDRDRWHALATRPWWKRLVA